MPFAATWMDLDVITLSKSERQRQIPYEITYMWNLKYKQMDISTKQQQNDLNMWVPRGKEPEQEKHKVYHLDKGLNL